jgi:hypothetical protein
LLLAALKTLKYAMEKKLEWFWPIFAKCGAKAARIAEPAAGAPKACGDAAFIETYARSLPKLVIAALNAHEKDSRVFAQTTRDNLQRAGPRHLAHRRAELN